MNITTLIIISINLLLAGYCANQNKIGFVIIGCTICICILLSDVIEAIKVNRCRNE